VKDSRETIIVDKNRQRAFWSLVIVGFMVLVSLILIVTGLLLDKQGILWMPVGLGTVGVLGFGLSAGRVLQTMRSPWRLVVSPIQLVLQTPTYLLTCRGRMWSVLL
jgi:hypothetical protein